MLVLSRKASERIVLTIPQDYTGGEILVDVVSIRGDKVRVGIRADSEVQILREELRQKPAAA